MKKIPKRVISGVLEFGPTVAKIVTDKFDDKKKAKEEELKIEKIYNDKKKNGIVKILSFLLLLLSSLFTIISIKNSKFVLVITGILSIVFFGYTYLLCLEILKEKKKNMYSISFVVGCMLLIALITFLYL